MFPAIIQFIYTINLPDREVKLYISQFSIANKIDTTKESKVNPQDLQNFISKRREHLLSMQSLNELKKDTNFDIQDIQAEVIESGTKYGRSVTRSIINDFNITLTLFLREFIVIGQFANEDFLIATIDHLPDFLDKKPVPVKKLHNFKSLSINTYQRVENEIHSI